MDILFVFKKKLILSFNLFNQFRSVEESHGIVSDMLEWNWKCFLFHVFFEHDLHSFRHF